MGGPQQDPEGAGHRGGRAPDAEAQVLLQRRKRGRQVNIDLLLCASSAKGIVFIICVSMTLCRE